MATEHARVQMNTSKEVLCQAAQKLEEAKEYLHSLSEEAQSNIQVNDTDLPELIDAHSQAKEDYESWEKRYKTNQRYLISLETHR
eukprot:CAMPEP_0184868458 /NCGR_PEP_ID=MMETSP0580-20130426/30500_1 /TAXON_ID=1118495 /ORGANISM="Dactyliosolen fragilissimus" /LENGTH=84 /DNA_ID=CAMNT_0027369367 /DNA_START=8 /DNA_END=265 /DNA_ORIENTATION=+